MDKGTNAKSKHIIFLGAGASNSSGYPLGDQFGDIIRPDQAMISVVWSLEPMSSRTESRNTIMNDINRIVEDTVPLFEDGAFATLDEFAYLARAPQFCEHVKNLKRLMRIALMHKRFEFYRNPQERKPDYYRFINNLFVRSSPEKLRDDITVLTYNYDPDLEHLLLRAVHTRNKSIGGEPSGEVVPKDIIDAVAGGWIDSSSLDAETKPRFRLFTLHGKLFQPNEKWYAAQNPQRAIFNLEPKWIYHQEVPPIFFPWEIFDESGTFIKEEEFRNAHGPLAGYHSKFTAMWTQAQREVSAATKVSFVGLQMHDYLKGGFKFLFERCVGRIEVVVANPDLDREPGVYNAIELPARSTARQMADFFTENFSKQITLVKDDDKTHGNTMRMNVVCTRRNFGEFIKQEM